MNRKSLYVPVLRSHRAERDAVRDLEEDVRQVTAPLIEVSRANALKFDSASVKKVATEVQELVGCCRGGELYLDLEALRYRDDFEAVCLEVQRRLLALQCEAMIILRLRDLSQPERVRGLRELLRRRGAGFRVTQGDYANYSLAEMPGHLKRLDLTASDVDLIVDCQLMEEGQSMKGTAARLETGYSWRSITYIGGSFPQDLTDLRKNDQHELPRHEWRTFSHERHPQGRVIRYGDYTVQHPFQADPPPQALPSGSIRYASDMYWVVMRGEKLDNPEGPGYQQYIAQAQLLCERAEFCGSSYSAGDAYIESMSRQTQHTGTPESWLRAGINHHLTLAARQIGSALAA